MIEFFEKLVATVPDDVNVQVSVSDLREFVRLYRRMETMRHGAEQKCEQLRAQTLKAGRLVNAIRSAHKEDKRRTVDALYDVMSHARSNTTGIAKHILDKALSGRPS